MQYTHKHPEQRHHMNDINIQQYTETEKSDYDYRQYERVFSGRMTKLRWQIIDRYCRLNSFYNHCHCEYDCCGHLCAQRLEFTYSKNQVVLSLTLSYNY